VLHPHAPTTPPRLGVIVNPNAFGVRRRRGITAELRALVGDRGEVVETLGETDLAEAANRFARNGVNVVATCGGDGTNLTTLTALVRAYGADRLPRFALLRGGTVNTVAQNLGVRGDPTAVLGAVLRRLDSGAAVVRRQDLLVVNGMVGFLFAAGMGARFLEAYYGGLGPGLAWAGLLAARTVVSSLVVGPFARRLFAPVNLVLELDGERAPQSMSAPKFVIASTVPDVGIGMRVAWRAGSEPGRFHVVASGLSTVEMAMQLGRVRNGQPLDGTPHLDEMAAHARLAFHREETFTLDGELFRARTVEISCGPALEVLVP
jgi:diacylglycerol kinase family enzyme